MKPIRDLGDLEKKKKVRLFCNRVSGPYLDMTIKTCWKKKTAYPFSQFSLMLLNCLNATQREMGQKQVKERIKVASKKKCCAVIKVAGGFCLFACFM